MSKDIKDANRADKYMTADETSIFSIEAENLVECITNESISSGAKGTLLKFTKKLDNKLFWYKVGRLNSRDNPTLFNIEPVIEVIASEYASLLKVPCIKQELSLVKIPYKGKNITTLACKSEDFRGSCTVTYLQDLIDSQTILFDNVYSSVCKMGFMHDLDSMMLFDFLILNEDRHSMNIAWLDNGFCPLFDNGFSMLYDDINGLLKNHRAAVKYCQCNSFYLTFDNILVLSAKYGSIEGLLDVDFAREHLHDLITATKIKYFSLVEYSPMNTVVINATWFECIEKLLSWRIDLLEEFFNSKCR